MPARKFGELANYIDLLLDAVCVVDSEGRFVYVSAGSERVFGYTPEEMVGRNITDMLHPDDLERTLAKANEVMQGKPVPHFENRYIRKDGSIAHIMWSARWSDDDKLRIAVARDISRRVRYESKQRATYAIAEAANTTEELPALFARVKQIVGELLPIDNFSIVLLAGADNNELVCYTMSGSESGTGLDSGQTACARPTSLALADELLRSRSNLMHHTHADASGLSVWLGAPLRRQDKVLGALLVSRAAAHAFTASDEELLQFVSAQIASAVERQQMLNRLQQLALYDSLTQLPNRSLFEDRMRSAMARARRDHHKLCLLYLDLDGFKQINDRYGHHLGDQLLMEVASRLKTCVRECDTVARVGGDEFVILLESIQAEHIATVIQKIDDAISATMVLESNPVSIEVSIGFAIYPEHGRELTELVRQADQRMYEAKRTAAS